MSDFKLGNIAISDLKLGTLQVSKLYFGTTLIWPTAIAPTVTITIGGDGLGVLTCDTTSYTLTANPTVQGTASYLWNTGATTQQISTNAPGVYTVTVTDSANGLTGDVQTSLAQNTTPPIAAITATNNGNGTWTLSASTSSTQGGVRAYQWSTGATTVSIVVSINDTYTVAITDNYNGCSDAESYVFTGGDTTPPSTPQNTRFEVADFGQY